ncbi:hypothetical protein B0T14DRAFT_569349 [Immersiella caudata]|uniref:Uncharacterized protein n=1 Tax=Immersiella caudata TaxID=314043 RepID=A0AA40BTP6_9PEZI|nr:hypothetical protein B0T14DRAFT_569349 [Immersiella caudata]
MDVIGVRDAFYRTIDNPDEVFHGKPALARWVEVTEIYLVNRFAEEVKEVIEWCVSRRYGDGSVHVTSVEQAEGLAKPGAVVACVSDVTPEIEEEKVARRAFKVLIGKEGEKGAMLEMCYNASPWTELRGVAEELGWTLKPGGWIEIKDIIWTFTTDDDTIPPDYAPLQMMNMVHEALRTMKVPFNSSEKHPERLVDIGFVDIGQKVQKGASRVLGRGSNGTWDTWSHMSSPSTEQRISCSLP